MLDEGVNNMLGISRSLEEGDEDGVSNIVMMLGEGGFVANL